MSKKKILLHLCAVFALFAVIGLSLYFIKYSFVNNAVTKTGGYFANDIFDSPSVELKDGEAVTQKFIAKGDIYGVKVRFHNAGTPQKGTVEFILKDKENQNVLAKTQYNSEILLNDNYTGVNFDTPYFSDKEDEYILQIIPHFENQNAFMALWADTQENNIALGIIDRVVDAKAVQGYFYLISFLTFSAVSVIYVSCFVLKLKKENLYLICLISVSVLFTFVLPPYSSPDEEAHINSAYTLANKIQGYSFEDLLHESIYKRNEDINEIFEDKYTTAFSYEYIYNNFFDLSDDNTIVKTEYNWVVYDFDGVYFTGALGILLGQVLNLGYVPLMFLGRLFNLLFFALCGYFAVKITPIGKEIFMTLSFLPITLHLANSFSRDVFVISLGFLLTAYVLYLKEKEKYTVKQLLLLAAVCVLLAPSKFIYAPMCLICVLLIKNKPVLSLRKLKQYLSVKKLGICAAVAVIALGVFYKVNKASFSYIFSALKTEQSLEWLLANSPDTTYNLGLILQNPLYVLKLVLNSIYQNGAYYIKSISGGVLSYNSVTVSDAFVFVSLLMLAVSVLCCGKEEKTILKTKDKLVFLSVFFIIFAAVVYVCLTWTPVNYDHIYGLQGKYLLPAVPLLLLACRNNIIKASKDLFNILTFVICVNGVMCALNAFAFILQR